MYLRSGNTDEKGQSPYLEVPGGEIIATENSVPETAADQENTGDNAQAEEKMLLEDPKAFAQKVPQMKMYDTTH